MYQPQTSWQRQVLNLQKRLEKLSIEKEMLLTRVQKAYITLEDIKENSQVNTDSQKLEQ